MNTQRKVVITTTYNEMGIIIDTKAEEAAQPEQRWIPVSERLPDMSTRCEVHGEFWSVSDPVLVSYRDSMDL